MKLSGLWMSKPWQHETAVKAASAAMPEVTEDYTPPAGIKYRAKIETAGVKTLNVQAALKNVRSMKVSEVGTLRIHRTGIAVDQWVVV